MAGNNHPVVRYSYRNDKFPQSAVGHAFKYLSAVTRIMFREDHEVPDISSSERGSAPDSARILIARRHGEAGRMLWRDLGTSNEWRHAGRDPFELIVERLALAVRLGPNASQKPAPSGEAEPTLSELVSDLMDILGKAGLTGEGQYAVSLWPGNACFGMAVTHDVDIARRTVPGSIRLLLRPDVPGGVSALVDSFRAAAGLRRNPYDQVRQWIGVENEFGIKSTFFIFSGRRQDARDPIYRLNTISGALDAIKQNGSEMAMHSSIGCFRGSGLAEARENLERSAETGIGGVRPHFLSSFLPEYWNAAAQASFLYTSCMGFDDAIGFINGIDLPFAPFDSVADKGVEIIEMPIAIMDCGLIGDGPADSEEVFLRGAGLIDRAASSGGMVVLDWHQRTFYNRDYPGWAALFTRLIHHAREKGAYFGTMSEIASSLMTRFREQS